MPSVEIYTSRILPLLPLREGAAVAQGRKPSREIDVTASWETAQRNDRARERPHDGAADFHRRDPCRRLRRTLRARSTPASSIRCSPGQGPAGMSAAPSSTFKAALVQMRSGRRPARQSSRRRCALIERSQARRRRLRADAGNDQHPGGQARAACSPRSSTKTAEPRWRPCASWRASSASTSMSARWRSRSRPTGGQPLVPDRSEGRDRRALRQDPHVRCRSGGRRKLSRIAQLPARRAGRASPTCRGAGSA